MNPIKQRERLELAYKNESQRYLLTKEDYKLCEKRQYIFVYRQRYAALKDRIINNARRMLDNPTLTDTDIDYRNTNENVLIVGNVYKKLKYRNSVLYEFSENMAFHVKYTKKPGENITDDADIFELEAYQQTLKLKGNIYKHHFVTGDVIGAFGTQLRGSDEFCVKMVIYPELPEQIPWPIIEKDCYVAFISGISMGGTVEGNEKTYLALNAFQRWINGEIVPSESEEEEGDIVQNVVRLVIAGDFVRINPIPVSNQRVASIGLNYSMNSDCFAHFDRFLTNFLQNLPVDLIPGANDPSPCMIPQQPVPWIAFEAADKFKPMLHPVTNPYQFSIGDLQFLGTSGQNLNDLERLTRDLPAMDRLERTLKLCHLFPTVPDTLSGFPFALRDPLVLDKLPHVYFCGNQPQFERKMAKIDNSDGKGANSGNKCLLLALPKFSETFEVILLNMRTLDAFPYSFKINWHLQTPEKEPDIESDTPMEED